MQDPTLPGERLVPRRPAQALALSVLLPGLGQLYNGQLDKGVFLFLAFAFVTIPLAALIALSLPDAWLMPLLVLSLVAALGLYAYGLWDAWRTARRLPEYRPREWQRPAVYVSLLLFAYLVVLGGATDHVREHLVESFRIPSDSMAPNVLPGDILFADKRVNCPGCKHRIRRGDIAIFVYPNDRTLRYIKRVIGLPGDEVRIRGREVRVNGRSIRVGVEGDTVRERGANGEYPVHWPPPGSEERVFTVPPGQVFVLGDNRPTARDSRYFGSVPLVDVVGRVRQVWLSMDPDGGIRWGRLGRTPP
jgi:signal peptidase I